VVFPVHLGMKLVVPLPATCAAGRSGIASAAKKVIAAKRVSILDVTVSSSVTFLPGNRSISLGEGRKVTEQREMLRATGSPKTGAHYAPATGLLSRGRVLKIRRIRPDSDRNLECRFNGGGRYGLWRT